MIDRRCMCAVRTPFGPHNRAPVQVQSIVSARLWLGQRASERAGEQAKEWAKGAQRVFSLSLSFSCFAAALWGAKTRTRSQFIELVAECGAQMSKLRPKMEINNFLSPGRGTRADSISAHLTSSCGPQRERPLSHVAASASPPLWLAEKTLARVLAGRSAGLPFARSLARSIALRERRQANCAPDSRARSRGRAKTMECWCTHLIVSRWNCSSFLNTSSRMPRSSSVKWAVAFAAWNHEVDMVPSGSTCAAAPAAAAPA